MQSNTAVKIQMYKDLLILTLVSVSPKIQYIGHGTTLVNFNKYDLEMSKEAELYLSKFIGKEKLPGPSLEVKGFNLLFWAASNEGIIIDDDNIHVYQLPPHIVCSNEIDAKLKEELNKII